MNGRIILYSIAAALVFLIIGLYLAIKPRH